MVLDRPRAVVMVPLDTVMEVAKVGMARTPLDMAVEAVVMVAVRLGMVVLEVGVPGLAVTWRATGMSMVALDTLIQRGGLEEQSLTLRQQLALVALPVEDTVWPVELLRTLPSMGRQAMGEAME